MLFLITNANRDFVQKWCAAAIWRGKQCTILKPPMIPGDHDFKPGFLEEATRAGGSEPRSLGEILARNGTADLKLQRCAVRGP